MKRKYNLSLFALVTFLLFLVTGCQALGNLDVNKALTQMVSEKSMEGNLRLTMELIPNSQAELDEDSEALFKTFGTTQLFIQHLKVQDLQTVSMVGELVVGKGRVPLHMVMVNNELAVHLEGALKPVVFQVPNKLMGGSLGPVPITEGIQKTLTEKMPELSAALIPYLTQHITGPEKVSVSQVTERINTETLSLTRVSLETYGSELEEMIRSLLTAILKDQAGIRELISQLYDLLGAELIADQGNSFVADILKNKELAVALLATAIEGEITKAMLALDNEPEDEKPGMFDKFSKLALNFYLDQSLSARRLTGEVHLKGQGDFQAIKLSFSMDRWNINQTVKADLFDFKDHILINENVDPQQLLANFDEESLVYELLKQDLHITRQTVPLPVGERSDAAQGKVPFIDENNRTLAPARFVTEILGANIEWNGELQQVTITDSRIDKVIVLTIGSNIAIVNGEEVEFDTAAVLIDPGFTYVPVRFIVEQLGAKVKFDPETYTVLILIDN